MFTLPTTEQIRFARADGAKPDRFLVWVAGRQLPAVVPASNVVVADGFGTWKFEVTHTGQNV